MKTKALLAVILLQAIVCSGARAADANKEVAIAGGLHSASTAAAHDSTAGPGGSGYRFEIANGEARVPVVVVRGTPYQMGWHLGRLMRDEIAQLVPLAVGGFKKELNVTDDELDLAWATTAGYTDPRLQQQLVGLAEGSGVSVRLLQHVHCLPLLLPYSCSSIAVWGAATEDGHLYQTRNLDWSLEAGTHDFPVLIVYLPDHGHAHVTPSFAGFIGAHCGMNSAGIVLSEMGDAPAREMPYNLHAPTFTAWFRTVLYDAGSLTAALDTFNALPQTKRYHFVFGDGRTEKKAVKIRVAAPRPNDPADIKIWSDNDKSDELAPNTLTCTVYQDEGRGAFPTLKSETGRLNAERLIALANQIPIKGGNVMNAVFDATAMRLWVSYAAGKTEAYKRPYVFLDLAKIDADKDGQPDWPAK
jgi:isopenicillin-N N-acyltransferase-like protein